VPDHREPDRRVPGCVIGVDVGISRDTTGVIASHLHKQRLIVDAVRIFRGTKANPVSLMQVETEILSLAHKLGARQVVADRWQAQLLAERLRARGLHVMLVTSDVASLDRWATQLKMWFSRRLVRIPNDPELIEQLEGLEGEEMRRRDRVRFTATGANHDDAAVALCLSAEPHAQDVGQDQSREEAARRAVEAFNQALGSWL
jgi:hypothetical protein